MTNRILVCMLLSFGASGLSGCGGQDDSADSERTESVEDALADCSTDLGNCYGACQTETPTPTPGCFTECEGIFHRCIESPVSMSAQ